MLFDATLNTFINRYNTICIPIIIVEVCGIV